MKYRHDEENKRSGKRPIFFFTELLGIGNACDPNYSGLKILLKITGDFCGVCLLDHLFYQLYP